MPKKYTETERIRKFWSHVKITGLLDCWEWIGYQNNFGYGRIGNGHGGYDFGPQVCVGIDIWIDP